MSQTLWAAAAAVAFSLPAQALTIVQWDFEGSTTPPDLIDSATSPSVAASLGIGTALGAHAGALTDWTTPAGNGSANSLSSNTWAVGDYYQFSFSTTGHVDVTLSVDQIGSSTGPRDFGLSYSTNGVSFAPFGTGYSLVAAPSWSSTTYQPVHTYLFDLSAIAAVEDSSLVVIRLVNTSTVSIGGGVVAAGGTGRVDNFTVMATPVPEAGTTAMLAAGLAVLGFVACRRNV